MPKIIHALVISRLDLNNGLLIGLPDKTLSRIQIAQNSAARLFTNTKIREHVTPVLYNLHWLPVQQRIKFKSLCTIHKILFSDNSPAYLKTLVTPYTISKKLRSASDTTKLSVYRSKNSYGFRLLSSSGAIWWNNLPITLKILNYDCFKKGLKTLLFNEYFN